MKSRTDYRGRRRSRNSKSSHTGNVILKRCAVSAVLAAALALAIKPPSIKSVAEVYDEHPKALPLYRIETDELRQTETGAVQSAFSEEDGLGTYSLGSSCLAVSINGVIRQMELEEYLVGVVAAEMPVSASPAALQAQAVAARTFTALHMAGGAKCSHGAEGCTVCGDSSCCQAYKSNAELAEFWGSQYESNLAKIKQAVESTRGIVVLYDGKLINALYHASSGKATENSEAVFAMALPYLVSVDSFEGESELVTVQKFNAEEFIAKINEALPDAHLSLPLSQGDIDVWGRTQSGRVQLVQLGETVIGGQQLRKLIGLKSTAFTVEISGDYVSFTCEGYGHGVGMSQYGAIAMAKEGYEYDEIIYHYYTGTELARLVYSGE